MMNGMRHIGMEGDRLSPGRPAPRVVALVEAEAASKTIQEVLDNIYGIDANVDTTIDIRTASLDKQGEAALLTDTTRPGVVTIYSSPSGSAHIV